MNKNEKLVTKNKVLYFSITVLVSLVICFGAFLFIIKIIEASPSYNPLETSITKTEKLIEHVNKHPDEDIPPKDIPTDLNNEECWKMLRSAILPPGTEYEISARQNGYDPSPNGLEDLIVEISFSNTYRINLHYFHGWLIDCQDNNEP
ncbi:MAG: hypothetical protein JNM55_21950 [Anaerolineales bacterium]|nr:hypothetical protein [Anaerolineales bacterium]